MSVFLHKPCTQVLRRFLCVAQLRGGWRAPTMLGKEWCNLVASTIFCWVAHVLIIFMRSMQNARPTNVRHVFDIFVQMG